MFGTVAIRSTKALSIAVLTSISLLWMADDATAETFSVSGTHLNFCCTGPATAATQGGGTAMIFPAFRGGAPVAKGGAASVNGAAYQTGTGTPNNPLDLKVARSAIRTMSSLMLTDHPNPLWYTLSLTHRATNDVGTLVKSGGPGNFEWCPGATLGGNFGCTAPSLATGAKHGRIANKAGPNKFGGTLGMLAGSGPRGKLVSVTAPGAQTSMWGYFYAPFTQIGAPTVMGQPFFLPGKDATHQKAGSTLGTFMITDPTVAGGPWSTGTVTVSITTQNSPLSQTIMFSGYDTRTSMGAGNIQLVSGTLYNSSGTPPSTNPRGNQLTLTLPEPGAGLGVAAGALGLALVGLVRARRKH